MKEHFTETWHLRCEVINIIIEKHWKCSFYVIIRFCFKMIWQKLTPLIPLQASLNWMADVGADWSTRSWRDFWRVRPTRFRSISWKEKKPVNSRDWKKEKQFFRKHFTLHMKINFVSVCLANINFRKWLSNIKLLNHLQYTVALKNWYRMHV